uniref:Uncharacterized protein n=1 Tax=Kalanchoe fedtschenkoi TaxID=63787 RepID=A0A7N0UED5_KALFE
MAGTESRTDDVQRMIDEYLSQDFSTEIDDIFLNVLGRHAETFDFQDNQLLNEKAIVMNHQEDRRISALGRSVIPMIASGFSQQGAAAIFVLAYNLKDPSNGQYIFDLPPEAINTGDVSYIELPAQVLYSARAHEPLPAISNVGEEAGAYCYLAASLLRMFIKSEEDYVRAFNQITTGYAKFFGKPMPISPPRPSVDAIRTLSHFFTNKVIYKASLFRILYCSGNTKRAAGMRRFLYENYLENTGMHAVSIFAKLCAKLNCRAAVLLEAMNSRQYHRANQSLRDYDGT